VVEGRQTKRAASVVVARQFDPIKDHTAAAKEITEGVSLR